MTMKVLIENATTDQLFLAIRNAQQASGRIDGLTQHKLKKILRAIEPHAKDWAEIREDLKKQHCEFDKNGKVKTDGNVLVFKSDEDKEAYRKVASEENEIELQYLLDTADLRQLKISGMEYEAIEAVVKGEAKLAPEKSKKTTKKVVD